MELYYEMSGSGTPIILVHGNGETHKIFDKAISVLQEHFTVYAIDSRGHGKSSKVSELHYDDMADDIYCFIKQLNLVKPVFIGFSDGGILGILLASKYQDLFSAMFICGANLNPQGMKKRWLKFFQFIYRRTKDSLVYLIITEPDIPEEVLALIKVPTFVTAGSHDMVDGNHTRRIADLIPHSKLKIFHPYGHGSYIVHNKRIARYVLEELKLNQS